MKLKSRSARPAVLALLAAFAMAGASPPGPAGVEGRVEALLARMTLEEPAPMGGGAG